MMAVLKNTLKIHSTDGGTRICAGTAKTSSTFIMGGGEEVDIYLNQQIAKTAYRHESRAECSRWAIFVFIALFSSELLKQRFIFRTRSQTETIGFVLSR